MGAVSSKFADATGLTIVGDAPAEAKVVEAPEDKAVKPALKSKKKKKP